MPRTAIPALVLALSGATLATAQAEQPSKSDPRAAIARKIDGVKADDLRPAPIPGLYELVRGTEFAYVSSDGRYVISGDLYDLDTNENLTDARRRDVRRRLIGSLKEAEMLVFAPKSPKHTVTIFTDIDCGYCRKLHSQMTEYNRLGIAVRYMFYPRTGPGTESWQKAEAVWCSPNRNAALTRAKRGEAVEAKRCGATPVARHYELGGEFGLRGTPAIVLADGDLVPGYLPPAMLAERLREGRR